MNNNINKEIILNFMKENNLSKTAFCKKTKITSLVFNKIMSDKINFGSRYLINIANFINVKISDLLII